MATKVFINHSKDTDASYNAAITQEVEETMSTTWSTSATITLGQEINYGVDLKVASVGGTTKLEFSGTFGKDTTKSQTVKLGSSTGVGVVLKPGKGVVVTLEASRGTMECEVEYEVDLYGDPVCTYASPHKGHYIHVYDMYSLLTAIDVPTTLKMKETIKVGFYSEATVIVRDRETKALLSAYQLDHSSGEPQWQLQPEFINGTLCG